MPSKYELSLNGVRDFLLSRNCRVKNHELVNEYKAELSDPAQKIENREKFKEFINTLCSIQVEEDEKVMVLKTRFHDRGMTADEISDRHRKASVASSGDGATTPTADIKKKSSIKDKKGPPKKGVLNSLVMQAGIGRTPAHEPEAKQARTDSPEPVTSPEEVVEETSLNESQSNTSTLTTESEAPQMSVLERARHMNRLQSQSDLAASSEAADRRRRHTAKQAEKENSGEDLSYLTVNSYEKEWMIIASRTDYQQMSKLLNSHPYLALRKDFTSGYTALHWAAKHGNLDVIKLLAGHNADMNARSHGGYTALHLAAMNGFEDVIEVLVRAFKANPNIRDNSGKKAKEYLKGTASQKVHQMLSDRRLSVIRASNSITAGLDREVSLRRSVRPGGWGRPSTPRPLTQSTPRSGAWGSSDALLTSGGSSTPVRPASSSALDRMSSERSRSQSIERARSSDMAPPSSNRVPKSKRDESPPGRKPSGMPEDRASSVPFV